MQRCQIWYPGSKAHTLFSSKWQQCSPHIQQFDAFFLAHSAKKLKETVFLHVRVHTYIINSYSINCSYVSLCDLPLLKPATVSGQHSTARLRPLVNTPRSRIVVVTYSMITYTIPSTTRIKASPDNTENERNGTQTGIQRSDFLFAGTYSTTFISEQNRTGTKAHVVLRRHTC